MTSQYINQMKGPLTYESEIALRNEKKISKEKEVAPIITRVIVIRSGTLKLKQRNALQTSYWCLK